MTTDFPIQCWVVTSGRPDYRVSVRSVGALPPPLQIPPRDGHPGFNYTDRVISAR
jgi:hypothetical protein